MNPTGQSVMLYKGTKVASLSGIDEIIPGEQSVPVSSVHQRCDDTSAMLEEAFQSLLENVALTSDQQNVLFSLLMEYADVFAISDDQLGRANVLQHEIHTEDVSPIRQRFRRMSPQKREEMQKLSDMLAKNIISPSKSPWASPVDLVKKKMELVGSVLITAKLMLLLEKMPSPCLGWMILWIYWRDHSCLVH